MTRNNIHPKLERLEGIYDDRGHPSRDEFSKSPCACCGDRLAGERYEAKAIRWNPKARGIISVMRGSFWVCPDCIYNWQ